MSNSGPLFTAYTGVVPPADAQVSPTSPTSPSNTPTFDFKVMIIRAKQLYTPSPTATVNSSSSNSAAAALDGATPVWVQLQVLDSRGTAIAPHFRYKSTLKNGPDPEWCESVLLKHLPCKPAQLEFSFYAQPSASSQPIALGAVVASSELLSQYWPTVADVKASVHSRYHRVSGGEATADAQFHYVLAPAYARLRHLTPVQSKPPQIAPATAASTSTTTSTPGLPIPRRSPPQTPMKAPPPLVIQNSKTNISSTSTSAALNSSPSASPPIPPFPSLPPLPPLPPHIDTSTPMHFHPNPLLSPAPALPPTPAPSSQPLNATDDAKRLTLRDRSIREFYDTERSYYTNLGILYTEFVVPLRQAVLDRKEINISTEQLDKMINNIETIYKFHSSFLADLENQKTTDTNHSNNGSNSSSSSGGSGGSGVSVGSVMLKYAQYFKIYVIYLNGYEPSISTINSLRNNRRFQDFLTKMKNRLNDISLLDLTSYLIMPVQRVPRYVLLLSSILSYTLAGDSEYELLHAALDSIKSVALYVNNGKRDVENLSKLVDVQDRISGGNDVPQLVEPYRRFIREGVMTRVSSGGLLGVGTIKEKRSVFFLFSDLLLWASASHVYKGSIWLVSASVERKDAGGKERGGWVVAVTSARSHLTIKFDNEADWTLWSDDISRCVDDLQSERNNQRVLYRAVKSRRKVNGGGGESGDNTPTAASGTTTPVHTADIAGTLGGGGSGGAAGVGYEGKDAVHNIIAEKLKELQLAKQHDASSGSGDEPSVSHNTSNGNPRRTSHPSTAFHTHNASIDGSSSGLDSNSFTLPPLTPFGTATGALERKAWRSPSATNPADSPSAAAGGAGSGADMVMPRAAGVGNVCVCLDREEGRRNSLKMGVVASEASSEAVKESRKRCPIHQLPEA